MLPDLLLLEHFVSTSASHCPVYFADTETIKLYKTLPGILSSSIPLLQGGILSKVWMEVTGLSPVESAGISSESRHKAGRSRHCIIITATGIRGKQLLNSELKSLRKLAAIKAFVFQVNINSQWE